MCFRLPSVITKKTSTVKMTSQKTSTNTTAKPDMRVKKAATAKSIVGTVFF